MAERNHAWFTFDLSKRGGLPRGARARPRPLRAEQRVLIVLLVRVVGVILRHRHRDGGGEELAPLARILEASERPSLLLIPYIYKQTQGKELQGNLDTEEERKRDRVRRGERRGPKKGGR